MSYLIRNSLIAGMLTFLPIGLSFAVEDVKRNRLRRLIRTPYRKFERTHEATRFSVRHRDAQYEIAD